jgi:DNA-directed RNA polymerase specialized sigma24 family protein
LVTELLIAWNHGDEGALETLTPLVYDELRRIARRSLAAERAGNTLQPTALVHEAFIRLVDIRRVQWQDRAHFFAVSARLMRRILEALAKLDARKARVVELRFFGGLSVDESAAVLKISPDTVMRDWKMAKAWLLRELSES